MKRARNRLAALLSVLTLDARPANDTPASSRCECGLAAEPGRDACDRHGRTDRALAAVPVPLPMPPYAPAECLDVLACEPCQDAWEAQLAADAEGARWLAARQAGDVAYQLAADTE